MGGSGIELYDSRASGCTSRAPRGPCQAAMAGCHRHPLSRDEATIWLEASVVIA